MNKEDTLIGSSLSHPSQLANCCLLSPKSLDATKSLRYLKSLIIQVVLGLFCNEKSNFMMNHCLLTIAENKEESLGHIR